MSQLGEHTWTLVISYHRCSACGFILESRQDYEYRFGKYQKDLECDRCHHRFTLTKAAKPRFGPFIGEPQPAEINWE